MLPLRNSYTRSVQQAAFFDLDKTVIAKSSTLALGRPFYEAGFLGRRALLRVAMAQLLYVLFGADSKRLDKARRALQRLTKGWKRDDVEQLVREALTDVVAPLVYAEALFLIDDHLRAERRVCLVSASPEEIVRPLAEYFGIPEVIATRSRVDEEGRYTGELEFYAYGPAKADEIRHIAAREGIDLSESYAYSDSATDLPLLEAVGHPVAVNPDRDLKKVAVEREWEILDFTKTVSTRERLAHPVPIISGASAVAVAGALAVAWMLRKRKPPARWSLFG